MTTDLRGRRQGVPATVHDRDVEPITQRGPGHLLDVLLGLVSAHRSASKQKCISKPKRQPLGPLALISWYGPLKRLVRAPSSERPYPGLRTRGRNTCPLPPSCRETTAASRIVVEVPSVSP